MTFTEATQKFATFKAANAPVIDGVKFRSRGKVFDLVFDLQLVDGKAAIIAKVAKEENEEPAEPKPTSTRKR